MSIYITGDIHGDIERINKIKNFCKKIGTTTEDYMIVLGDVGIDYHGDFRDTMKKTEMSKIPITFVMIRGNHEMRPSCVRSYTQRMMFCGPVYVDPAFPNLVWLQDGEIYDIEGKSFLAIGGAYSVDKYYRLQMSLIYKNYKWFADEQLSEREMVDILYRITGKNVDYVLTHTAPISWEPTEMFLSGVDQSRVDKSTERFLETVKNSITFNKKWFFGHYHGEKNVPEERYEMLYKDIKKIE